MPTIENIKQALDTYEHVAGSVRGDLTALDLWARRAGLWQGGPVNPRYPQNYSDSQIDLMAGEAAKEDWREGGQFANLCPLKLGLADQSEEEYFAFKVDPVIAVSGGNQITTRHVAKSRMRGTIKESWAQDDWKIDIRGVLAGKDADDLASQMQALKELLDSDQTLCVVCPYLQDCFSIERLVVQSYSFPATKGMRWQQFQLSCLSDEEYDLLEEI